MAREPDRSRGIGRYEGRRGPAPGESGLRVPASALPLPPVSLDPAGDQIAGQVQQPEARPQQEGQEWQSGLSLDDSGVLHLDTEPKDLEYEDPWEYAKYHATQSAANFYSAVHWIYRPPPVTGT